MKAIQRAACLCLLAIAVTGCDEEPAVVGPVDSVEPIACNGVPAALCAKLAAGTKDQLNLTTFRSIRITCTQVPCTEQSGQVSIEIVDSNGRQMSTGQAWASVGNPIGQPLPKPTD